MLTRSKVSMYKITLFLSFVLSCYLLNIRDCKLKMYKNNSRDSSKYEHCSPCKI